MMKFKIKCWHLILVSIILSIIFYIGYLFLGTLITLQYLETKPLRNEVPIHLFWSKEIFKENRELEKIPRVIHQTWKNNHTFPQHWKLLPGRWKNLHPDFKYILWTDEENRQFLETYYPWFLETYDSYPYHIQRVDAIRYFLLYKYGGIYTDLDIAPRYSLVPLLQYDIVLPKTRPGLSNDILMAAPGHPYMKLMIDNLKKYNHYYGPKFFTVMISTGPIFVSQMYYQYPNKAEIWILPPALYSSGNTSLLAHYEGGTWHSWEARFFWDLSNGNFFPYLGHFFFFCLPFCICLFLCCIFRNKKKIRDQR